MGNGENPVNTENNQRFFVEEAKNGEKILYIEENGNRIRMNSSYDPTYEAETWSEKYHQGTARVVIAVFGLSDGYFLRALKKRFRPDTLFIVYEPSISLFHYVYENFDLDDLIVDKNIFIYLPGENDEEFYNQILFNLSNDKTDSIGIVTPGYNRNEQFTKVCEEISLAMSGNLGYRVAFGKKSLKHTFFGLSVLDKNYLEYDLMEKIPKDIPIVLVAGGPSLLKNIDVLKTVNGRAIIVCVDRAASVMLEHGIIPDMTVTVDPIKSADFLHYEELSDVPLIATFSCNIDTQRDHSGNIYYSDCQIGVAPIPGLNGKFKSLGDVGGSVATFAYKLFQAEQMKTVILIGQDLAYEGERTHADDRHDEVINKTTLIEVEGMHGEKLNTSPNLKRFLDFYEREIKRHPEVHVVDATEGGALIHGSEVLTLREAIDKYCTKKFDFKKVLNDMPHAQTLKQHEETIEYMRERLKELDEIKRLSKELVPICYRLMNVSKYGEITDKKYWKMYNKVDELRSQIFKTTCSVWLEGEWIMDSFSIPDHVYYIRNNEEAYKVYNQAYEYYKNLPKDCDEMADSISETFGIDLPENLGTHKDKDEEKKDEAKVEEDK